MTTGQCDSPAHLRDELRQLYFDASKHAVYQSLPDFVQEQLDLELPLDHNWRSDRPRYEYLIRNVDFRGLQVADIGANIGFFALSLAHSFGARVVAYEANPNHARMIERIAAAFGVAGVQVHAQGVGLREADRLAGSDFVLFNNVAHHAGHDFDAGLVPDRTALRPHLVAYLRGLAAHSGRLCFQMGYNWGGDKSQPIVPVDDCRALLDYTCGALTEAGWRIDSAALAHRIGDRIEYTDIDWRHALRGRRDKVPADPRQALIECAIPAAGLSEFYRRPLFLCSRGA